VFSSEIPQKVQENISKLQAAKGYYLFNPQTFSGGRDLFVLISSGEKHTGGYLLELNNITAINGTLKIEVEEKEPPQEKAVIQVLTYPILLLKIKGDFDHFDIANTLGETLQPIHPLPH